jgi:hypothetical protein
MHEKARATGAMIKLESPCNKVCRLNPDNICIGCGRSLEEIGDWSQADAARRLEICQSARERKLAMGDLY